MRMIFLSLSVMMALTLLHQSAFASNSNKNLMMRVSIIQKIEKQNPTLKPSVLFAGLRAYDHLRSIGLDNQGLLTLVDFNLPSNKKRLWVLNIKNGDTKYFTYVSQGENTGFKRAEHFSNQFGSHESSIGVYVTGEIYYGVAGRSMRVHGLDMGFNNNAYKRDIVVHPAKTVSKHFAKKYNRVGNTDGCFGLDEKLAHQIISTIQGGTIFVAYYPNKVWLDFSPFEQMSG